MAPDLKRRSILKTAGALSLLLTGKQILSDTLPRDGILQRPIHSSGERLPVMGLGTYQSFGVGTNADDRDPLRQVLELFVQHGGSVIDSSPMYGTSEQVIGDLSDELALRPKLFMATKVWTSGDDAGTAQMNESFQRMRVKVMDLMQIHNLMDWRTHAKTLAGWKEAGKVRYTRRNALPLGRIRQSGKNHQDPNASILPSSIIRSQNVKPSVVCCRWHWIPVPR